MRRTAVILGVMGWLALGLFTGIVVAQSSERPQLRVAEPTFDMGTVPLGTLGQYRVALSNTGTAPLTIKGVKPG
jgi:hypothetical protein